MVADGRKFEKKNFFSEPRPALLRAVSARRGAVRQVLFSVISSRFSDQNPLVKMAAKRKSNNEKSGFVQTVAEVYNTPIHSPCAVRFHPFANRS